MTDISLFLRSLVVLATFFVCATTLKTNLLLLDVGARLWILSY